MKNLFKKIDRSYLALILLILALGALYFVRPDRLIQESSPTASGELVLPVKWQDLGQRLIETGVIDNQKITALYQKSDIKSQEITQFTSSDNDENLVVNKSNNNIWLNLFWALGLSNKNAILEKGPMSDPQYGGAGHFASTDGWTIASGDAMNYYSRYEFIKLDPAQQSLVERAAKNIYRPCCDNSTYFPDCNHGMAMLGLLELLAANNVSENQMYEIALAVNSFWFPNQYEDIDQYLTEQNQTKTPQEILGKNFSSASGFKKIIAQVKSTKLNSGDKCSI